MRRRGISTPTYYPTYPTLPTPTHYPSPNLTYPTPSPTLTLILPVGYSMLPRFFTVYCSTPYPTPTYPTPPLHYHHYPTLHTPTLP